MALCRSESLEETGEESGQESPEVGEGLADVVPAAAEDGEDGVAEKALKAAAGEAALAASRTSSCRMSIMSTRRGRVGSACAGERGRCLMAARIAGFAAEANQTLQFRSVQFGGLLN